MASDDVKLYVIVDTHTGRLWKSRRGKITWNRRCDAANAWNVGRPYREPKFSEQEQYVVKEAKLTVL